MRIATIIAEHTGGVTLRQLCAGAIVRDDAGRLLVVQRGREPSAGRWSIPGGRCLPGEAAADACVREVREETGIEVVVLRAAGRVKRAAPGAVYVIDDFVCTPVGGELLAGDDARDARWVTLAEFDALPLVADLRATLAEWGCLPR
jgi:ADP-ribose pyrophosphatase YjhB (NUDIX family)